MFNRQTVIKTLLTFICLFGVTMIYAQKVYDVKGIVKNTDGQPVKEANITLIDSYNKTVQHTVTVDDGTYFIQVPDSFPQIVEVSHVSYNSHEVYLLNRAYLSLLKNITLENKSNELSEVKVTGSKPKMYFRENALVVNISNNPAYQHQPTMMLLKKMPGTEVDNKSNITLYGKSVMIYIDGIPQRKVSANMLKNIISAYPVKAIEEIEINPNSTGQYGSEPMSSYINIITKKGYLDGSLFTFNPEGKYIMDTKCNGALNGMYVFTKGRFSLNAGISYEYDYDHNKSDVSTFKNNNKFLQQNSESKNRTNVYMGSVNANYKFENNGMLSAYFDFYDDFSRHAQDQQMSTFKPVAEKTNLIRGRNRGNADQWITCLRYQSDPKLKHSFIASYGYMWGGRRINDYQFTRDDETMPYVDYDSKMFGGIHNILARYTYMPDKNNRFTLEASPSYGRLKDRVWYDEAHGDINNVMIGHETNLDFKATYLHNFNKNLSTYLMFGGKYTDYDVRNEGEDKERFHYFNIMPYAHIRYVSDNQNYNGVLAVRGDVIQPQYTYMLNGIRYNDDYNYTVGSGDIESTYKFSVILQQYFFKYIYLNIGYAKFKDLSGAVYQAEDYITVNRHCNYADEDMFSATLEVPFQFLGDKLSGNISMNAEYHKFSNLRNGFELNDGRTSYWSGNVSAGVNYSILKNLGVYATYKFFPRVKQIQMEDESCWYLDCGMYWSPFKDDRMMVTFDASDVFDSFHYVRDFYYGDMSKRIDNINKTNSYIKLGFVFNLSKGKKQDSSLHNAPIDTGRFR